MGYQYSSSITQLTNIVRLTTLWNKKRLVYHKNTYIVSFIDKKLYVEFIIQQWHFAVTSTLIYSQGKKILIYSANFLDNFLWVIFEPVDNLLSLYRWLNYLLLFFLETILKQKIIFNNLLISLLYIIKRFKWFFIK